MVSKPDYKNDYTLRISIITTIVRESRRLVKVSNNSKLYWFDLRGHLQLRIYL